MGMENISSLLPWGLVITSLGTNFAVLKIVNSKTKNKVSKDVCKILHAHVDKKFSEIKKDTKCIPDIKAGIDLLVKRNGLG